MKQYMPKYQGYIWSIACLLIISAQFSAADQAFAPPEVKAMGRIDCKYIPNANTPEGATITFTKDNKVVKTMELHGKIGGTSPRPSCKYSVLPNYFETYIAITELNFKKNTLEEYSHRGIEYEKSHNIRYYDTQGNLLFEKRHTVFLPIHVENNGVVVCYQEQPEELIHDVSPDLKFPYESKVFFFSPQGDLLYEKEVYSYPYLIKASNNAKWILLAGDFGDYKGNRLLHVKYSVEQKKEVEIDSSRFGGYGTKGIDNEGSIIIERKEGNGPTKRYTFDSKTFVIKEIGTVQY
jgi:hypothetical protein